MHAATGGRAIRGVGPFGLVLVVLAACLPLARTLGHDLVWDDHYLVADVDLLAREGGLRAVVTAPFLPEQNEPDNYYRPVVHLSLWADGRLGGGAAGPYHASSLLFHAVNSVLVVLLLFLLTGSRAGALFGALVFAVHPVQVEPVAFVSARTDLLAACLVIVSTLGWVNSRRSELSPVRRATWLAAAAAAYSAGALAKETAVVLPIALAAWDALGRGMRGWQEEGWWSRNGAAFLAFGVALAAVAAARVHALGSVVVTSGVGAASQGPLLLREPALALAAATRLLGLLVLPWPLNSLYERDQLTWGVLSTLGALALGGGVVWLGQKRRDRAGWMAGSWIAIFLAPALLVPSGSATLAAERYLYIPAVGLALLAAKAFQAVPAEGLRRAGAAVLLLASLAAASAARAAVWKDDLSLTTDQVRTAPNSAFARDLHGQALLARGRWEEALEQFRQAVTLEPSDAGYHNDFGIAWRRLDRPDLAASAFRESIRLNPNGVRARLNLAYACVSLRDGACIRQQRAALGDLDPGALRTLDAELGRLGVRPRSRP